ncbi:hypothetical protein E2C01_020732 [Portunus trituberculatus]|uniref:Uncharacterized protein n=1 Tax=Portunus trituberculatus TaxID=210409 RepID=A0A5B7E2D5_PORTR|nr:hypothetical protein [Portunus trituberculatus]
MTKRFCCENIQRLSAATIFRIFTSVISTPLPERSEAKTSNNNDAGILKLLLPGSYSRPSTTLIMPTGSREPGCLCSTSEGGGSQDECERQRLLPGVGDARTRHKTTAPEQINRRESDFLSTLEEQISWQIRTQESAMPPKSLERMCK